MADRLLHPRSDATNQLAVSLRKLDELIAEKAIKVVKIGRTLVPHRELLRFVERASGTK